MNRFVNFQVCQPMMPDGSTCADSKNIGKYIVDFTCQGEGSSARMLKEMRLSFPSGHSSFSFYTMVFCAVRQKYERVKSKLIKISLSFQVYLQKRMVWRGSKLLKHALQFVLIGFAWFTALSRISNYKHHWSDVLAGGILGITVAVLIVSTLNPQISKPKLTKLFNFQVNFVSDLCKSPKFADKLLPTTRYELSSPNHVTQNGNNNQN